MIFRFGYYITESSEHTSEYTPWYIKDKYPELIEKYNIPIDEYLRRCVKQINDWKEIPFLQKIFKYINNINQFRTEGYNRKGKLP